MPSQCDDLARLKKTALLRFFSGVLIIGSVLFVSAGTLRYWQGWLYLAVIFMPMSMFLRFLIRKDPALLERRMRTLERESVQKAVVFGSLPFFLALFKEKVLVQGLAGYNDYQRRVCWRLIPGVW